MFDQILQNVLIGLCAANLLATIALLVSKSLTTKPLVKEQAIKSFVDEGIALAEQSSALNVSNGLKLTSQDKMRIAVDWARDRMSSHKLTTDDAELRKFVEIRLVGLQKGSN